MGHKRDEVRAGEVETKFLLLVVAIQPSKGRDDFYLFKFFYMNPDFQTFDLCCLRFVD